MEVAQPHGSAPSDRSQIAPSWSPDGAVLAFAESFADLSLLSMDGERTPTPFLHTEFLEAYPRFSPDGRWISYESNESGQFEVYIRPFPRSEGKWQVSTRGGAEAHWNPKGKEIFYRAGDAMMAVDVVATESGITLGNPIKLFDWTWAFGHSWDVASDGERFVMIEPGEQSPAPTRLRLIMNWSEELKRLVPTND